MSNLRAPTGRLMRAVESPVPGESSSPCGRSAVNALSAGKKLKQPFWELFSRDEILHYSIAAAAYITLGVFLQDVVLNWVIGPLFIVAWMWWIAPIIDKARSRLS